MTEEDRQVAGRYTVQSVARALRLVEIVAGGPPGGLSLSELARNGKLIRRTMLVVETGATQTVRIPFSSAVHTIRLAVVS